MADGSTHVDVHSLEDFHRTLAARLDEVEQVAKTLALLRGRKPALGAFEDARTCADHYEQLYHQYAHRVEQLRSAVVAAQHATATIIHNYRRTEDRNHANATDIASQLTGVATALKEEPANAG
ncbi:MAG TPA: hypothetical protein VF054_11020 [Micromonosporaceae bacterium]